MTSNVVRLGIDIGSTTVKVAFIDEDGNILMTLDTITPEDFEVTEEAGITTATLVIRDK